MDEIGHRPGARGTRKPTAPRRRGRAGGLVLGCMLTFAVLAPLATAAPALADPPTVDCGADPGNGQCGKLTPVLTCVWVTNSTSQISAVFGYENDSSHAIVAGVGASNAFSPAPAGRGQPTSFAPNTTVSNAFVVTWSGGGSVTWTLNGSSVSAGKASSPCSAAPAPAMAEAGVILGCLLIGVLVSVGIFRERGSPKPARLLDRILPR